MALSTAKSSYFTVKRSKSGSLRCFVRSQQVGSICCDGDGFWATALRSDDSHRTSDTFPTFASADQWLFQNYA